MDSLILAVLKVIFKDIQDLMKSKNKKDIKNKLKNKKKKYIKIIIVLVIGYLLLNVILK
jgi:hypothetical protein